MAKKIFIAATGQHCGKTTMSVALIHLLKKQGYRVGFMKPVGQEFVEYKGLEIDKDAALMHELFKMNDEVLDAVSPIVIKSKYTQDFLDGKISNEEIETKILQSAKKMDSLYDYIILEGTGHGGVGSVIGFNNAKVAAMLNAKVLLVCPGGIGNAIDRVHMNMALYEKYGSQLLAIMANKVLVDKREKIHKYLSKALNVFSENILMGFDYVDQLSKPSFNQIAKAFKADVRGDVEAAKELILNTQIGAASSHRMSVILKEKSVLIIPGTRDDLIMSMASLYDIPKYKEKLVGLILTGEPSISPVTQTILNNASIPHFKINKTSIETLHKIKDFTSKLNSGEQEKLNLLFSLAEKMNDENKLIELIENEFN